MSQIPVQHSKTEFKYELFRDDYARFNIADACEQTADYANFHQIENMIFIDRAARAMWPGVRESYKIYHPESKVPSMYFMNPKGFDKPLTSIILPGYMTKKLEAQYPALLEQKEKPTMLIDTCIHSGRTAAPIIYGLAKAGFSSLHFGVISDERQRGGLLDPSVVLSNQWIPKGCYPFGHDIDLVKKGRQLYSERVDSGQLPAILGRMARKEIRQIVKDSSERDSFDIESAIDARSIIIGTLALELIFSSEPA